MQKDEKISSTTDLVGETLPVLVGDLLHLPQRRVGLTHALVQGRVVAGGQTANLDRWIDREEKNVDRQIDKQIDRQIDRKKGTG